jgi:hypothetical protein
MPDNRVLYKSPDGGHLISVELCERVNQRLFAFLNEPSIIERHAA